ncbi:MAG: DegT/DnrJ/EryC1/StrS family aminotransferase [Candidatus Omnitrophica bacterium]|nr:DegT/DnrJ/EryC1/StrS family aminotransferase [Candidatus Omnitrophota bacterium]
MHISLLDLKGQYRSIKPEIDETLRKVIERQDFILGEECRLFEEEITRYCGSKYAVGVASGTDALILALRALNIGPGDEVITTSFTFFATAEAVSLVGAKPVFVDIEPKTYNIDTGSIEKAITPRTKAIIPVHLYGQCADMDPIIAIARKRKLRIIEDTAQAIGATYKGRKAGSMGDIGTLSFFPSKNLGAFGDAGMIITNDKEIADKIRMLRVHGSARRYIHSEIGMNSRLDNLQAAVLSVKLKYLDSWLESRRRHAKYYCEKLKDLPLILPYVPDHNVHTYHQYVLRIKGDLDTFMKFLADSEIEARTYYPVPLHLQECYRHLGYRDGSLKEAERAAGETLAIAVYPELTIEELDYVINRINAFFER